MRIAAVEENQILNIVPILNNALPALVHLTPKLHYKLLHQLRRAVPFIEIIIEEESKTIDNITKNLIN